MERKLLTQVGSSGVKTQNNIELNQIIRGYWIQKKIPKFEDYQCSSQQKIKAHVLLQQHLPLGRKQSQWPKEFRSL
jgi:hypothetical protein